MPAREPLVSLGVPVYNGARFIEQALESLLAQTLADFELIISDNASTDGTGEICRRYAARDERVRYHRQQANIGGPGNWNFVALQARGRYFKWAGADDFCDPRMLEKCVAALEADPGAVLCQGRTCIVDEETGERRPFLHDFAAMEARPSARFRTVRRSLVLNNAQSGVIRRDVLRRTRLDRPYPHGDVVLTAELALHGRLILLPEVLFYRRMGEQTWSMRRTPEELKAFYDPCRAVPTPRLDRWRQQADYVGTVLRAPVAVPEKLATLALISRVALGDSLRALRRSSA